MWNMRRDTWVIADAQDVGSRCNIGERILRIVVLSFPVRGGGRKPLDLSRTGLHDCRNHQVRFL